MTRFDELPIAIWETILTKLNLVEYIRFSAVCISWRAIAAQVRHPSHQIPCLMVYDRWAQSVNLCALAEKKFYYTGCSKLTNNLLILGSCHGWLILKEEYKIGNLFLFNPFSSKRIHLPVLSKSYEKGFTNYLEFFKGSKTWYGISAILSSAPTSDDCTVVIHISEKRLAFCKIGDAKWTVFQPSSYEHGSLSLSGMIFHKGQLHLITRYGLRHSVYKLGTHLESLVDNRLFVSDVGLFVSREGMFLVKTYLVESSLGLLLVCKYRTYPKDDGVIYRETSGFDIYRMRTNGPTTSTCFWVKVESLGHEMLFLDDKGESTSVSAIGVQGFKGNCIYFTQNVSTRSSNYNCDCAVFDLKDGSIKPFMRIASASKESMWVTLP